jgi:GNAT superfamily N-acetyltransferase
MDFQVESALRIDGPELDARAECEAVLRSLPTWFGIEEALVRYVADTARLPTFAVRRGTEIEGFLTLREHFPKALEVHCLAVRAQARRHGYGCALLRHAEAWLTERNVEVLQVKTIAMTKDNRPYAETREYYDSMGFTPLEVFQELWSPSNPCLQLVKFLKRR